MEIVCKVDAALYQAGLTLALVLAMFDDKQADMWCERIFNEDAQYKYISPYVDKGINNLFMLQGSRRSHRRWWLSQRFALYDAKFVSGEYKSNNIEVKLANAPVGLNFKVTSGYDMYFGYGVNNVVTDSGRFAAKGDVVSFSTLNVLNVGDPLRVYAAPYIGEIDFSEFAPSLTQINLTGVCSDNLGSKLTKLILGGDSVSNISLSQISGLASASALKYLDIRGFKGITALDLSECANLESLIATNSGVANVTFAKGAMIKELALPSAMKSLKLEQLPYLEPNGLSIESNGMGISSMRLVSCPKLAADHSWVFDWLTAKYMELSSISLYIDNVDWNMSVDEINTLCKWINQGADITLKGHITLDESSQDLADTLTEAFGSSVFKPTSELYVSAPEAVYISGPDSIVEGNNARFTAAVFSSNTGTISYKIIGSRTGVSIDSATGVLTCEETGASDSTINVAATFTSSAGDKTVATKKVTIQQATYPSSGSIIGNSSITESKQTYTLSYDSTGKYDVEWSLEGDITDYVRIDSFSNSEVVLEKIGMPDGIASGTLTAKVTKRYNNVVSAQLSIEMSIASDSIVLTKAANPELLSRFYKVGLCKSEDYMTSEEAQLVTDEAFNAYYSELGSRLGASCNIGDFSKFEKFTNLTEIGSLTFWSANITKISFPKNITKIGERAFKKATIGEIKFNESLEEIGEEAFYSSKGFHKLELPANIKVIGQSAFNSSADINEIVFPDNITQINRYAFGGLPNLKEFIYLNPKTIFVNNVFSGCSNLELLEYYRNEVYNDESYSGLNKLRTMILHKNQTGYGYGYNPNYIPTWGTEVEGEKIAYLPKDETQSGRLYEVLVANGYELRYTLDE
jgi:hypothetical protein